MAAKIYKVNGMDCADCALNIEKGVRQLKGVEQVRVDFSTGLLFVEGDAETQKIQNRVEKLGYTLDADQPAKAAQSGGVAVSFWRYLLKRRETRLALAGGAILLIAILAGLLGAPTLAVQAAEIIALVIAGYPIARSALANLWINHAISINLLMTIAAVGAVAIGQVTESATLIFLFAISEALEGFTADRARRVLDELGSLAPAQAVRLQAGKEEMVPVSALRIGDEILIKPGERIPMDGQVQSGHSGVNQAPITGESVPVAKEPGDTVFAGAINDTGALTIQVTRLAQDTTIQRIIQMIQEAQSVRAPTQRFVDRFARIYTPLMVILAALVAALPPLLFGQPFLNPPGGVGWLYRALALLVIACPCALVISAPVTIISAITAAARKGVLFKGGAFLERLCSIELFAFDKTGTLTHGQPVVTACQAVECAETGSSSCAYCDDVLALASALERRSSHPLAHSVVTAAQQRGLDTRYAPANEVVNLNGSGLQGHVNGKLATIGSHKLFDIEHPHLSELCDRVEIAEKQGQTAMLVCDGDRVRGFITVADTVRSDSLPVVNELKALGRKTALLTGDNAAVAKAVGEQVGVDDIRAGLLPEDKVAAVQALSREYGAVAMVGDGINDAPALASAALGIAVGGASSAQAMETADIVLMAGDLRQLPFAVRLSHFARSLIRQNVVISLGIKFIFVLLALGGLTSLWLAVLADVGVSLLVTTNGMRAARYQ